MIKPIFILFLNLATVAEGKHWQEISEEYRNYIQKNIGEDYVVLILPVTEQPTSVNIFYPGETTAREYTNLLAELAKTTSLENIRIQLKDAESD